jgi:hypothetical protein
MSSFFLYLTSTKTSTMKKIALLFVLFSSIFPILKTRFILIKIGKKQRKPNPTLSSFTVKKVW